ncbi:V0D/AC39 family V-type ATPase subunit [Treponema brennaborense]|nr:V-type ATPase subunit [Treponema brennaborense]
MDHSGAAAFIYAKASGMLAKSFIGTRAAKLFEVRSLPELWTLVFKTEVPMVPEVLLAKKIEQEAESRFLCDYTSLLRNYSKPDSVLVELVRFYDYDNLKDIAAFLSVNKSSSHAQTMPQLADIGEFSMFDYTKWPDIAAITAGSPVSWYDSVPEFSRQQELDTKLDLQYIRRLWASIRKLPAAERRPVESLIKDEIVMYNIIWALRLKVYYGMSNERILDRLASAGGAETARSLAQDPLSGPAVKMLDFAVDSYAEWENWKYAGFLNLHEEGVVWEADPRWIQQSAKTALNRKALRQFHQHPFTACVLVSWFKIKQYELDCIRTAAEGLRLNVSQDQVKHFAGVADAQS